MSKLNTIGVDLAKNIIQISLVSAHGKELQNSGHRRRTELAVSTAINSLLPASVKAV